jgi:DnaJ-class molecular chaperone
MPGSSDRTPYVVLLAKPNDSDETIRRLYHAIVRYCHPDAQRGLSEYAKVELTERWHTVTVAYNTVKTDSLRSAWAATQFLLSGQCGKCAGSGVVGTRMFKGKIRVCEECGGNGRNA